MEWAEIVAMSRERCGVCGGDGSVVIYVSHSRPCRCVLRGVFRACLSRFREIEGRGGVVGTVRLDLCGGGPRGGRRMYGNKGAEFCADFVLLARRVLSVEAYRVFAWYHLLGASWALAARRCALDRGNFFHTVYGIEATLGAALVELRPYALFPLDEYFGSRTEGKVVSLPAPRVSRRRAGHPLVAA